MSFAAHLAAARARASSFVEEESRAMADIRRQLVNHELTALPVSASAVPTTTSTSPPGVPIEEGPAPGVALVPLDLDRPLRGCRVAVIDTETTGFESDARVVEVGIVLIRELGITPPDLVYSSFVNPDPIEVGWRAFETHGIGAVVLRRAPPWSDVWPQVAAHVAGALWCAHNAVFDHRILASEASALDLAAPPARLDWLDTQPILKVVDAHLPSRSLEDACRRRHIQAGKHRAAADAMATALLLVQLLEELAAQPELRAPVGGSVRQFLSWQGRTKKERERDAKMDPPDAPPAPTMFGMLSREAADEIVRRGEVGRTCSTWSASVRCRRVGLEQDGVRLDLPRSVELALWEIEDGKMHLPKVVPDVERPFWHPSGVKLARLRITWRMIEAALWSALVKRVALHLDQGRQLLELRLPGWEWDEITDAARAARRVG